MKKISLFAIIILTVMLAGCTSVDYSVNASGTSDHSTIAVKDFVTLGIVTVYATEIHHSGPLGFTRSITGSKVTYASLLQEAAKLEADDIINVRVDMTAEYDSNVFEWLTGWTKTYKYIGTALAIKYTDKVDTQYADPHLGGLPKVPEPTGIIKINRSSGRPVFK